MEVGFGCGAVLKHHRLGAVVSSLCCGSCPPSISEPTSGWTKWSALRDAERRFCRSIWSVTVTLTVVLVSQVRVCSCSCCAMVYDETGVGGRCGQHRCDLGRHQSGRRRGGGATMGRCFRGLVFPLFAARGLRGRRSSHFFERRRLFFAADSQRDIGRAAILRRCVAKHGL